MSTTSFRKRNLAQQLAEQLSQMINQNQWFAGRRLPAVRELADQFGVPVHAIGIGERASDMQPFSAREYADSLMGL